MHLKATLALGILGFLVSFQNPCMSQQNAPSEQSLTPQALAVLNELRTQPDWLFPADECPAEVIPDLQIQIYYLSEGCEPDLQSCFIQCRSNDANACYGLALAIQEFETDEPISEALFLRSCRLGIPSGCTNRAAGMTYPVLESANSLACAVRAYEKTCERNDPWGCTMHALHLARGEGVTRDLERAGRLLQKACQIGRESDGCRYAAKVAEMIEDSGGTKPELP